MGTMEARDLLILYGSETGCARDIARRIANESRRHHFMPEVIDMDSIHPSRLMSTKFIIFVCSTTGQGDAPGNMKRFWRILRRRDFPRLNHLNFAIFGLGDSSYPLFNAVARRLRERLVSLGASMLVELGLGDDQHPLGCDGIFDPWLVQLMQELAEWFPLPDGVSVNTSPLLPPMYKSHVLSAPQHIRDAFHMNSNFTAYPLSHSLLSPDGMDARDPIQRPRQGRVRQNTRITPTPAWTVTTGDNCVDAMTDVHADLKSEAESEALPMPENYTQDVHHIVVDLAPGKTTPRIGFSISVDDEGVETGETQSDPVPTPPEEVVYQEGDVLCIHPPIPQATVTDMLQKFKLHALDIVSINFKGYASVDVCESTLDSNTSCGDDYNAAVLELKSGNVRREGDLPHVIYAYELFTWYLNFHATPKRSFFEVLAHSATSPLEEERLMDLISPDYVVDLDHYCGRERRYFSEVIMDFPSCHIPLDYLLELVPRISPRSFSISSSFQYQHSVLGGLHDLLKDGPSVTISEQSLVSSLTNATKDTTFYQAHVCIAALEFLTPYKRKKLGLCSTYLCGLESAAKDECLSSSSSSASYSSSNVWYSIRRATFKAPAEDTPSVLVGPGTGIASIHSIVEDRVCQLFKTVLSAKHLSRDSRISWAFSALESLRVMGYTLPQSTAHSLVPAIVNPLVGQSFALSSENISTPTAFPMGVNAFLPNVGTSAGYSSTCEVATEIARGCGFAPTHVLFGCRYHMYDQHYRDFFHFATAIGAISSYHSVFSRTQITPSLWTSLEQGIAEDDQRKLAYLQDKYVQDRLKRGAVAEEVFQILSTGYKEKKGLFLLAGNAKQMPREVRDTVIAIVSHFHPDSLDYETAKKWVERLADETRYVVECWS